MPENAGPGWIDPNGVHYPLKRGETHQQAAYGIRMNEELGEPGLGMAQTLRYDPDTGESSQKGKDGAVAKYDIANSLGDPNGDEHIEYLCNRDWVMASASGSMLMFKVSSLLSLRGPWETIYRMSSSSESVVFVVGTKSGGVSAGLCGEELSASADDVMLRISNAVNLRSTKSCGDWIPRNNDIRYFQ